MRLLDPIAEMDWLSPARARTYRWIMFAVALAMVIGMIALARDGIDPQGKPLGTDFLAFWSASQLALAGDAGAPYDLSAIYAIERAAMPVDPGPSSFLYPPPFLLLCLPLALAPYFLSLCLWLAVTGTAYVAVARQWLSAHAPAVRGATVTILAFPAVLMNIGHGQNGFLTAAILGAGLLLLDRRPWLAGILLGALVIKPQLALAVPILVLASGRWRVMVAGLASSLTLCALSWVVLGPAAWSGFFAGSDTARGILEQGLVEPYKMVSLFAAVQLWDGGALVGYIAQGVLATAVLAALAVGVRREQVPPAAQAALCAAATPLLSPFILDYDLTILAFPLAWLLGEGLRRGFKRWEKAVLIAGYLLPLVARDIAMHLAVPLAPLVIVCLFLACFRAARRQTNGTLYTSKDQAAKATFDEYALTARCQAILATRPGEKYQAPDGSWQTRGAGAPQRDARCP